MSEAARNGDMLDARETIEVNRADEGEARAPVALDELYYNMSHPYRGMALIFNHEHFDVHDLRSRSRSGTNVDCGDLKKTLEWLGFRVSVFRDPSHKKVCEAIEQAASANHSDYDCLLVAVMTHGKLGRLYAKDTHYKMDTLWESFTPDRSPTLAGKPKLFFIQACQGKQYDGGVILSENTETDGHHSYAYKIPADFLIAYSTISGYISWRNSMRGSWFIQALVQELRKNGKTKNILEMLTNVNHAVAFDYESYVPDLLVMHQQKQMPSINFTLTRLVVFGEKS